MALVSFITPSYNSAKFVSETILSVQAQTISDWELVIVNDGSTDNSPNIINSFAKNDHRIRIINQNNSGSAAARNNALRNATGRYICFLDADDILAPNFISSQLNYIRTNNAALVFASYNRIDVSGKIILRPFIVPSKVDYNGLLKTCSISCLTAMYDREKVGEHYFNEDLRSMRDDYVFWLSMLKKINIAYGNKEILGSYRIMTQSTTGNKRKVIKPQFDVYYKIEKLGIIKSLYYMLCWAMNSVLKYI